MQPSTIASLKKGENCLLLLLCDGNAKSAAESKPVAETYPTLQVQLHCLCTFSHLTDAQESFYTKLLLHQHLGSQPRI